MEATLKFNLPEEGEEFEITCDAQKMHSVIFELRNNFFRHLDEDNELDHKTVNILRERITSLINESEIRNL
jgi:hypothetical protein